MSNNDWKQRLGMVYSTSPDYEYEESGDTAEVTLPKSQQQLRVWLDRRHRAGKMATIVKGFVGGEDDLAALARHLKVKCGVGGSAKEGEIIIQGDHRERVVEILIKEGYPTKKAGS